MRIFVDVDDTLKLIDLMGEERGNSALIESLQRMCGACEIIVWTVVDWEGTPEEPNTYAEDAAEQYLATYGVHYSRAIGKDLSMLQDGDIAIDDTEITGYRGKWMTANEFIINFAENWRREYDASHAHAELGGGH